MRFWKSNPSTGFASGKARRKAIWSGWAVLALSVVFLIGAGWLNYWLNAPTKPGPELPLLDQMQTKEFWKRVEIGSLMANLSMGFLTGAVLSYFNYRARIERETRA